MVEVNSHSMKGSTLIETLVAMVIISLVFGLSITFFSNRSYSNNLKTYQNTLKLKRMLATSEWKEEELNKGYVIQEFIIGESACIIQSIATEKDSNQKASFIQVIPVKE